jgi:hypothetical protein
VAAGAAESLLGVSGHVNPLCVLRGGAGNADGREPLLYHLWGMSAGHRAVFASRIAARSAEPARSTWHRSGAYSISFWRLDEGTPSTCPRCARRQRIVRRPDRRFTPTDARNDTRGARARPQRGVVIPDKTSYP